MIGLFRDAFKERTVFITGHTGFIGSWMAIWLKELGARLVGFSLAPPSEPNLFSKAGLSRFMEHIHGDVRDIDALEDAIDRYKPEFVFHLAAQALVRESYREPVTTYATNVMGTVNLLEIVRGCSSVRVCQIITSDKCYRNIETDHAYREENPLGGRDPYSSSKAAAELVASAYMESFLKGKIAVSTFRAGNIIGGGDWGKDRLLPDCILALQKGEKIFLRNPEAVRPWQFVLEPVSGYLHLASLMALDRDRYSGPWNLGPSEKRNISVGEVADRVVSAWGSGSWEKQYDDKDFHEAGQLNLDVTKAVREVGWAAVYGVDTAVEKTVSWYKKVFQDPGIDVHSLCLEQILEYVSVARGAGQPWAKTEG